MPLSVAVNDTLAYPIKARRAANTPNPIGEIGVLSSTTKKPENAFSGVSSLDYGLRG